MGRWFSVIRNAAFVALVIVGSTWVWAENLKPADLVGSWVRVGPADMSGMEFTKEGKVLLYYGQASRDAETDEYSFMDDGRLNLPGDQWSAVAVADHPGE